MRPLLRRIGNTSNTSASDIISPPTKIPIKSPAAASRISFPGNDGCSKKIRFPAVPPKMTLHSYKLTWRAVLVCPAHLGKIQITVINANTPAEAAAPADKPTNTSAAAFIAANNFIFILI